MLGLVPKMCATKQPPPEAEPPQGPLVPMTSATTPPIWHPPEPSGVPAAAAQTGQAASPPPSAELVRARAAAEQRDYKKVRSLLDKKVRGGKGVPEESQLLYRACVHLKDRACADAVKAKHPEDIAD
jgi:hypothetical protein